MNGCVNTFAFSALTESTATPVRSASIMAAELNTGSEFLLNAPAENYKTQQAMFEYEKVAKEKQMGAKSPEEQARRKKGRA